jgi:hypothetical protein
MRKGKKGTPHLLFPIHYPAMRKGKKGTPHLLFPIHYPGFQAFVLIYKTYIGSHLYFSPHHRATPSADVINNQFWRLPRSYPRRPRPLPTSTLRSPVASPSESPRLPPIFFKVWPHNFIVRPVQRTFCPARSCHHGGHWNHGGSGSDVQPGGR